MRHHSQTQKMDRMSKLKTGIEYLERGMQRIRTTLTKLQQDPTHPQKHLDYIVDQRKLYVNKIMMLRITHHY